MATGRTIFKFSRVYAGGYDLSGYTRSYGPLGWEYEEIDATCPLGDSAKGYLPGQGNISLGAVNTVLDPVTGGPFTFTTAPSSSRVVMIPIGIRAAPAMGDPVFCGQFIQTGAHANNDGGLMTLNIPFGEWDVTNLISYTKPWGVLLHALGAETGANSANTNVNNGGATTAGGYFVYQITAYGGTGNATVSVDDSANGTTWLALSGATSGAIAHTAMPCAGIVALATTATVRQYLRFQVALSSLSSVTFASAFVRI